MKKSIKEKYIGAAFLLLVAGAIVKIIGALYKIPLTAYIGATGRGYFSAAYNLCLPVFALTIGALPLALSKLVSKYDALGDKNRVTAFFKASDRLFLKAGFAGFIFMLAAAVPYCKYICSSPGSVYTVFTLAPSVFFCCLAAGKRAYAEGFLDMKPSAVCQLIEAVFKLVFGLLFARISMSWFLNEYEISGTVLGVAYSNENEALSAVYPFSSAASMLGVSLGSAVGFAYVSGYTRSKYGGRVMKDKALIKDAYRELTAFCAPLIFATAAQSISLFANNASFQYALSLCEKTALSAQYDYSGDDIYTYVYGLYSSALDFKNLVPGITMALGVTAVPAVSSLYESSKKRFEAILITIMKYTSIIACLGGIGLALFKNEIPELFYSSSNSDIAENTAELIFYMGVGILPCCIASSSVFCAQAIGLSSKTTAPFIVGGILRFAINLIFIPNEKYNILAAVISDFAGYTLIFIWNMATIRKKTGVHFSVKDIFIKPLFCAAAVYFASKYIKSALFSSFENLAVILICGAICSIMYFFMLVLVKSIRISDIFNAK